MSARIITLKGGKAGEGKSLIAQNLASVLVRQYKQKVIILDLDPETKLEYKLRWNLKVSPTLVDFINHASSFDSNTILGYFANSQCGVEVVSLALDSKKALSITTQQIITALEFFKTAYDFIILDNLIGLDTLALSLLDISDNILGLCSPELIGLPSIQTYIEQYQTANFPANKLGLILNRANLAGALKSKDIAVVFKGYQIVAEIPWEPKVVESLNKQMSLVVIYPNTIFSKAIHRLADWLINLAKVEQASDASFHINQAINEKEKLDKLAVKNKIHQQLLENDEVRNSLDEVTHNLGNQTVLGKKIEPIVSALMATEAPQIKQREEREQLVTEIVDEALGLGPLENLIKDPSITEIMVNHKAQIYIEKQGRLFLSDKRFLSDQQLIRVIQRIVAPIGRRIDESQPYVDARLNDGSRVNAIIPPLALKGPALTIRKFSKQFLNIEDLIAGESFDQAIADFLALAVRAKKNIVISGGTGSGKTTLLNLLAQYIPKTERVITVEDSAELQLYQPHVVALEARAANIEGQGAVSIRDLVRNCLRMRPDRIVVGECRGAEALDMLQAMNTGHEGSLTTVHANSAQDAMARLETMVLMAGVALPLSAIREQLASAVDLVIQQTRLSDGRRKLVQISEVAGIISQRIALKDIFVFDKDIRSEKSAEIKGNFKATGYMPVFAHKLDN